MRLAKKIAVGTGLTVGVTALVAGFGLFRFGNYVRNLIYPPTFRKYVALFALPLTLYSIKHPEEMANGIKQTSYYIGNYIFTYKEDEKTKKILELENKLKSYSLHGQEKDLQKQQELSAIIAKPNLPQSQNSNLTKVLQEATPVYNSKPSDEQVIVSQKKPTNYLVTSFNDISNIMENEQDRTETYSKDIEMVLIPDEVISEFLTLAKKDALSQNNNKIYANSAENRFLSKYNIDLEKLLQLANVVFESKN